MIKILGVVLLALGLAACDTAPPLEQQTSAQGVTTSLIAVVDGCNVWAVDRGGMARTVYLARCPEGAADVQSSYQTGRRSRQTVDQQTVGAQ